MLGSRLDISVVVPIRNAIRTLPSCLSALERLDPAPRELLLVDNGSSDGSLELIQRFAKDRAPEIRVITEGKRGASAARNAGIKHALGEVVARGGPVGAQPLPVADCAGRDLIAECDVLVVDGDRRHP